MNNRTPESENYINHEIETTKVRKVDNNEHVRKGGKVRKIIKVTSKESKNEKMNDVKEVHNIRIDNMQSVDDHKDHNISDKTHCNHKKDGK